MVEWVVGGLLGLTALAQIESWAREHYDRCKARDRVLEKQARATRIAEKRRWIAEERAFREMQAQRERDQDIYDKLAAQGPLAVNGEWLKIQRRKIDERRQSQAQLAAEMVGVGLNCSQQALNAGWLGGGLQRGSEWLTGPYEAVVETGKIRRVGIPNG